MLGKTISHYRILEKLGEGGMGVVYKAEDTRLGRVVALKFLPSELTRDADAKARFIQEAQAASALDHPNICTIHEIDETDEGRLFICMAYYDGETLKEKIKRGRLDAHEAIRIAMQVGQGLAKAHSHGMVHRDIKPANIVVTDEGVAKILDFGLAKLAGQIRLTKASSTLGTVAYMSPEQAGGKEVDRRADIWSLGVILYEMLTGRLPFKGEYEQSMLYSIMNEAAAPLGAAKASLPKELQGILDRALAKRPDSRYQHIGEMLADLESCGKMLGTASTAPSPPRSRRATKALWLAIAACAIIVAAIVLGRIYLSAPHEDQITSIAVLPFRNMSPDPGEEYFSDGMTEAIIKELSQIKALRVISLTSVMRYRNTQKMVPEIAHELGVDAVVEGSVLRADRDVRITAQLIAAHPEKHLWADDFTRTLENVLLLQSEVAQAIAREINVTVTPNEQERMARTRVVDPEAHEAYLRGRFFARKSDPDDWYRSMQYFQQAIGKDSTFALAYAGIAEIYDRLASAGIEPPREAWPKVKAYTDRALALDPALVEGFVLIADMKYSYDWDVKGAEEYYKRALEIDPNHILAHFWYGWFLITQGRFEDGIAELKRGVSLDPLWPRMMGGLVAAYECTGEYDSAFVYLRRMAEIDSNDAHIYVHTWDIYMRQGKYAEAIEVAEKGLARGITPCFADLAIAYALAGQTNKARATLAELLEQIDGYYFPSLDICQVYCALGDREKALEYLERAYQERSIYPVSPAFRHPWCDFLESDPRYREIRKKIDVEQ